jgi:hypothetical protein
MISNETRSVTRKLKIVLDAVACIYITERTKRDGNRSKAGEDQSDTSCEKKRKY